MPESSINSNTSSFHPQMIIYLMEYYLSRLKHNIKKYYSDDIEINSITNSLGMDIDTLKEVYPDQLIDTNMIVHLLKYYMNLLQSMNYTTHRKTESTARDLKIRGIIDYLNSLNTKIMQNTRGKTPLKEDEAKDKIITKIREDLDRELNRKQSGEGGKSKKKKNKKNRKKTRNK